MPSSFIYHHMDLLNTAQNFNNKNVSDDSTMSPGNFRVGTTSAVIQYLKLLFLQKTIIILL